ncbi:hemin receptor [Aeromicrobium phragmitis]|uniref:Hemin receptor n=1 Tax=Aeromicrobium phragmitis TaxID=2478914 RepID=A0A3L8PHV5_9ACTN|nr:ABC transporter substrate-binding protein [Aeromicrobium phragmitis]RLV54724.1 hemin receptor [Aeromicrobium phragmitis]
MASRPSSPCRGAVARRRRAATVIVTAALALVGCAAPGGGTDPGDGAGERTPLEDVVPAADPRALEGPATAVLGDRSVVPVADAARPSLPVTVTSFERGGATREVTVDDVSRIVAFDMSGSIAATVWGLGLGDRLVGRDQAAGFAGIEDVAVVTSGGHAINAEAVMALRPSVIVTDGSVGPRDVVEQLRSAGVPVVFVERDASVAGAAMLARSVGEALGAPQQGEALAQRIQQEVERVTTTVAERFAPERPLTMAFLYIRGDAGIYYLFGPGSGADDLITRLGGRDIGTENGWGEYTPLTDEALVAADPDVILVMTHGLESAGGVDGLIDSKPAIAATTAGRQRRIIDMADADVLSFGPRSAQVIDALARALYAEPDAGDA